MTNELCHHGVKGQSWGKRNGPPYPLYRKSAYYKKTGKRPPGYTGDKKGESDSGGTNKSGKIGGLSNETNDERRSALKRKILKGAGIAVGAAALAGAGYLAYRNRGAIASKAGSLRDNIRYKLGEMPGTAKINATRVNLKNRILNAKNASAAKIRAAINEVKSPTSALRNDIRLVGASAKGAARNVGNAARNAGIKVKNVAAKPGQTVYNKIAGKSKAALKVAKNESQVARNNARTLKNFMDDNAKAIEKTTIAKRQALAKIRRGEGNLEELNRTANNLAVRERALIAKQNTAKTLAPRAVGERVTKAEAVRQAQAVFARRNKLGRIAAGATNVGVGAGLLGTAGATGYGISKIVNRRKQKARIQNRRKKRR